MPIATIGRTVHVCGIYSNGSNVHPAVITRVFGTHDTDQGPAAVNLTVFPDLRPLECHSSVPLYSTEQEALAAGTVAAFWPARA